MNTGSQDAVSASWVIASDEQAASNYQAVGERGWSAGPGHSPYAVDIGSASSSMS
jgi:hypothetical protein